MIVLHLNPHLQECDSCRQGVQHTAFSCAPLSMICCYHCAFTWRLYVDPGVSYKWRGRRSIDSNTAINFRINATAGRLWKRTITTLPQNKTKKKIPQYLRKQETISARCFYWWYLFYSQGDSTVRKILICTVMNKSPLFCQ